MRTINSTVLEVQNTHLIKLSFVEERSGTIYAGQRVFFQPTWDTKALLPSIAYVVFCSRKELYLYAPDLMDLTPGVGLSVSFPSGNGFLGIQPSSKLLILLPPEQINFLSNYIITISEFEQTEISVIPTTTMVGLPRAVEVVDHTNIDNAIDWADILLTETQRSKLSNLFDDPIHKLAKSKKKVIEILVHSPYGCKGIAECALCEVTDQKGKRIRLCDHGPVLVSIDQ